MLKRSASMLLEQESKKICTEPVVNKSEFTLFAKETLGDETDVEQLVLMEKYAEKQGTYTNIADHLLAVCRIFWDGKMWWCFDIDRRIWIRNHGGVRRMLAVNLYRWYAQYIAYLESNPTTEVKVLKDMKKRAFQLMTTREQDRIMTQLKRNSTVLDPLIEQKMNNQIGFIAMQNRKLFDLNTLTVTERTVDSMWSMEATVNYIPHLSKEQELFAEQYFLDLMCQDMRWVQYLLDAIKSSIHGGSLPYMFMCVGNGRNGKSLLFQLLMSMFPSIVIPQSKHRCLMKKKPRCMSGASAATATAKPRMAIVSDLDGKNEKLKLEGVLQAMEDNTATVWTLTNTLPNTTKCTEVSDRMKVIPFNARFNVSQSFSNVLSDQIDVIFTYIMQKGNVLDNFTNNYPN